MSDPALISKYLSDWVPMRSPHAIGPTRPTIFGFPSLTELDWQSASRLLTRSAKRGEPNVFVHLGKPAARMEYACAGTGGFGMLLLVKAFLLTLLLMSVGLSPVISDDAKLKPGSSAVATDPTGSVLGTDSTQTLDQLMDFVRNQDLEAVKKLKKEGHVVEIRDGSRVTILSFDSSKNAYKVRMFGSNKELWLIKENVVAK
jgi:hypothetical protein